MRKLKVTAKIKTIIEDRNKRTGIKADDVVRELAAIGFVNIANCFDKGGQPINLGDMPKEVSTSLETYKIESDASGQVIKCHIKQYNKISALDALMKHTGAYQPHNTQKQTGKVVIYLPENGR